MFGMIIIQNNEERGTKVQFILLGQVFYLNETTSGLFLSAADTTTCVACVHIIAESQPRLHSQCNNTKIPGCCVTSHLPDV